MNKKKILAISGSTRKTSSNLTILQAISQLYKNTLEVDIYDKIDTLPHFNPDLTNGQLPLAVQEFQTLIAEADGIIICTPEYVFSLPGSLKNAIEWNVATTLFSGKPLAFIVAAASGEKAFESLDLILTTIEARLGNKSRLLIKGAKGKTGEEGEITDKEMKQAIETLVSSLVETIDEVAEVRG